MFSRETGATKLQSASSSVGAGKDAAWVTVQWMPHSSLSPTSHLTVAVRSIHAVLDTCLPILNDKTRQDWRVEVSVHGIAGLSLIPVSSSTLSSPVVPRRETPTKRYPSLAQATHDCYLDDVIHLPIRWRDLPRDALLQFHVMKRGEEAIFCANFPLFTAYGRLQTGLQRVQLDRTTLAKPTRINPGLATPTPKEPFDEEKEEEDPVWKASRVLHQLDQFAATKPSGASSTLTVAPVDTERFGDIISVPWLDALTRQHCQNVLSEHQKDTNAILLLDERTAPSYLILELPVFEVPIMYEETIYPPLSGACGTVTPLDLALYRKKEQTRETSKTALQLVPYLDYGNELDNPVEDKYRTLAHDLLRGLVDPALKPDREQRDRLASIIASPSHHPTREEKDLLWRFRFSLVDNRRALTKFLLAVDWTVESEAVQAAELLEQWRKRSPIEVTDALKLLGKHVAFQTDLVRQYAIDTLASAPDAELRLYLLQLVQAIKYETVNVGDPFSPPIGGSPAAADAPPVSSLANFLIGRAAHNIELANYLYWYLKVELQDPAHGARYRAVFSALKDKLSRAAFQEVAVKTSDDDSNAESSSPATKESKSSPFLSIVDSVSSKLSSSFRHGELHMESSDPSARNRKPVSVWDILIAQDRFVSGIMNIQMKSRDARGKRDAKEIHLKELLSSEGYDRHRGSRSVPLPSAPHILVNGVNPQSAKVFKSALYPALVEFHVDSYINHDEFGDNAPSSSRKEPLSLARESSAGSAGERSGYKVLVKTGDDLRQDQLVIMMIRLMDGLLKRGTLDLCLTPYSIIAMSPSSGLVEFVSGSIPISQVLANYNNSIMHFFQSCSPEKGAKYNVRPEVISNYVRSCAGYCVITYIIGVGDRHLDNIMLQPTGHFFHIDFGFIFGRDPKPLPPAFRLTREMVEGMGGVDSTEYRQFCSLACQAFNTLRKSAGLILNLLHLMNDAGIEDLSNNPSSDAEGVISKVEDRFKLELTDEDAERFFLALINDSLAALAPRVMDVFHSLAVARR